MTLHTIILAAYALLCVAGFLFLYKKNDWEIKVSPYHIIILLVTGFAVRSALAWRDYAFWYDVGCFKAWADCTTYYGLGQMYHSGIFLDYPPGYMYVLYLTKIIQSIFSIDYNSVLYTYIIKLPAMLADIGGGYFIYRLAIEKKSKKWALFTAACFIFCPATIYNSAVWGQIDSYYTLLLVAALYFVYKDSTVKAAVAYALALITKPQSLLFGPVLLFYILEKKSWKEFFKAVITGLGCLWVLALPFGKTLSPLWLINLYKNTFGGYRYFTVNGYNLFMLFDKNWAPLDAVPFSGMINIAVIAACFAFCMYGYFRQTDKAKIFSSSFVFITVFFSFCTMMHERYMHPAIILALICYILTDKKEYFFLFLGSVAANFMNIVASMRSQYNGYAPEPLMYKTISIITVAVCLFGLYVFLKDSLKGQPLPLTAKGREWLSVGVLTAVYAFFAFYQLGDTASPQTFWQSQSAGEWVIINFNQTEQVKKIRAFTGMGDQYSPQGSNATKIGCDYEILYWTDEGVWQNITEFDHDYVFTWQIKNVDFTSRSVLIRAKNAGQILNEIVFTNEKDEIIRGQLQLGEFNYNENGPHQAVDESETLPADTGYYSSMYFDEIYHARTAYEQLKGYSIYETTHPPLGKIIISIGIALLGMTPFGWRFMGTLRGVVMVVIMYLLAKQLFRNEKTALLCSFIFAFDFMHYTQTRLATVDSFLVLFVMLMFLFMLKYAQIPLNERIHEQYLHLLISGIFMGCAIAVKWNGAYGAAGLAVYYFAALFIKHRNACSNDSSDRKRRTKQAFTTCLWCVIAFVLVPAGIYFASFAPVLRQSGISAKITEFFAYQVNMFDYHSKLVAEHFFSSPWYTWPFIQKPIWYSATYTGASISSISAFGNIAVWPLMPFCLVYVLINSIREKDSRGLLILTGYLGCFLPWILITRLAFIYHYFPATVFGVLAIGYRLQKLTEKLGNKSNCMLIYPAVVFICFIIFLPVLSGVAVSQEYANALELLPTWYFA
ncbi:MAG: phospholipid carrier-dependent glycosyltransferase [Oscillospiraceae bacterium]|nr:phospholipid carrier-dependent glycosyltransferase [Oscillospiraceae bacterium]